MNCKDRLVDPTKDNVSETMKFIRSICDSIRMAPYRAIGGSLVASSCTDRLLLLKIAPDAEASGGIEVAMRYIYQYPEKIAYVEKLRAWAEAWHPAVRDGFQGADLALPGLPEAARKP